MDVTKPYGEKIEVEGMADGSAFHPEAWYTVVVNSYRGNGGGELFTKGAGIPHGQLNSRLVASTDKDLRSCIIQYHLIPFWISIIRYFPSIWKNDFLIDRTCFCFNETNS